jgi:hypothetical protein
MLEIPNTILRGPVNVYVLTYTQKPLRSEVSAL